MEPVEAIECFLGWLRRADVVTPAEIAAAYRPGLDPDVTLHFIRERAAAMGDFTVETLEALDDYMARAIVVAEDGSRWIVGGTIVDGVIIGAGVSKAPPPGVEIRSAVDVDGPAIAELMRRTPIVAGSRSITIDPGPDYLAALALTPDRVVSVAERDGELIGVHGAAIHSGRLRGESILFAYLRHTRIAPEAQGIGLFSTLAGAIWGDVGPRPVEGWSLIAVDNEHMLKMLPEFMRRWPVQGLRLELDCAALADAGPLPFASTGDAERVAELRAGCHGTAELWDDLDAGGVRTRVEQAPGLYGWDRVALGERAVVAVGRLPAVVTMDADGERSVRTEATAYDVAAEEGGEAELVSLLRRWCAALRDEGVSDLVVLTTTISPLRPVLEPLARSSLVFAVNLGGDPPPGVERRGVHLDPVLL